MLTVDSKQFTVDSLQRKRKKGKGGDLTPSCLPTCAIALVGKPLRIQRGGGGKGRADSLPSCPSFGYAGTGLLAGKEREVMRKEPS
jgi:hypothetical protein